MSRCDLGDGGDDAGNDADVGSGGGVTMMVAMMTVVIALVNDCLWYGDDNGDVDWVC